MSSNAQKTPFARSLHAFGDDKVQDWLSRLPKSMPATVTAVSGALVTVSIDGNWAPFNIPKITVPKAESRWAREPTQVGDKGYVNGVDYYLGGQSGLGGGAANLYPRANLTNAVFQPLSQKGFPSVDQNAYTLSGPNGVVLQDENGLCVFKLTPTGITITIGSVTYTIDATALAAAGGADIKAGTVSLLNHVHSGVTTGSGDTGGPVP